MKHFTKIMFAITVLFGLYACSSDDDNSSPDNNQALTDLYKKWVIQSTSESAISGGIEPLSLELDNIESIEFTDEGVFVILETDGEVTTGSYTINGSILDLGETGTITINELNDSSFSFTFEISNDTLNLIAEPADLIATNDANQAMFRLWTVQNLDEINAFSENSDNPTVKLDVLFTPYGTYMVNEEFQDGSILVENSFWQWKNTAQTEACYKFDEEEMFDCDENFFRIESLTETEFRLLDLADTQDQLEYVLVPVN